MGSWWHVCFMLVQKWLEFYQVVVHAWLTVKVGELRCTLQSWRVLSTGLLFCKIVARVFFSVSFNHRTSDPAIPQSSQCHPTGLCEVTFDGLFANEVRLRWLCWQSNVLFRFVHVFSVHSFVLLIMWLFRVHTIALIYCFHLLF